MTIRVHYITHVPFEGLGSMASYFNRPRFSLAHTPMYEGKPLPPSADFDWLIIMGGPMSVHDNDAYPWLDKEKAFIESAINDGKAIIGICLGAQLIAEILGADVYQGAHREIGWHPISSHTPDDSPWSDVFPKTFEAFHWHGETFDIPAGALPLGSSIACANQGFIFNERVLALQFHLETTPESAGALISHCGNELDGSLFVQDPSAILADIQRFAELNRRMVALLNHLEDMQE